MKKKLILFLVLVLLLFGMLTNSAEATVTYSFEHLPEDKDGSAEILNGLTGEAQLFVEVTDYATGQVLFTFLNTGPEPSIIADIYFYDGLFLGIADLIEDNDFVDFEEGANPGNLPGFDYSKFVTGFSIDAEPPPGTLGNGIDPGESLGVLFNVTGTYADVLGGLDSGLIVIGLHVQGFADGGSEAFINNGVIPAPGACLLGGIGVTLVGCLRRKRTL